MPATFARAATRVGALLTAAALLVVGAPASARAQTTASGAKALVYCPVGVDVAGCDQIVKTLTGTAAFPGGVDRAYDGTSGTVDLAYVTLSQYAVLIVPSLADDSTHSPYAVLRSAVVQSHLKAGVTGRIAVWGGTPDLGSDATTRPAKDQLLRNLASWGATDWAVAGTTGLVALADLSADAARRYDWLAGVSRLTLGADPELYGFDAATPLTGTAKEILKSGSTTTPVLAYANMASFGLVLPSSASVGTTDATGTADSSGTTVTRTLLVTTAGGGNTGAATIRTDKSDYAPGSIVTFSGTGWSAGETVTITLHENPTIHADDIFTAVADASGNIVNAEYSPESYDLGTTYYATAKGGTSGLVAQTSFTDGNGVTVTVGAQSPSPVVAGNSASYVVSLKRDNANNSFTATVSASGLTGGAAAAPVSTTFPGGSADAGSTRTVTLVVTTTGTTTTQNFTIAVTNGSPASTAATLTVARAATVTLGSLSRPYGAANPTTGFSVASSSGFAAGDTPTCTNYQIAATATATAPAGSTHAITADCTAPGYSITVNPGTLTITKADQTISFTAPSGMTFGDADVALSATATSGLSVAFGSTTTSVCTIDVVALKVHAVAAGTCSVQAVQPGNTNYNAAPPVTRTFTIGAKAVVVTPTTGQSKTFGAADPTLTFTNDGGLAASAFTGGLDRASGENAGTYAIALGTLSAGANYSLSLSTTPVTFEITRATPTFSSLSAPHVTYAATTATITGALKAGSIPATGSVIVTVAGTGGSLTASSTLDASGNFSATVNPSGLAASTTGYAISLSYAQTTNFNAASDNSLALFIDKAAQTISFGALGAKTFGDGDFSVSATATSGLAVSFAATGDCTVGGSTVHLTGAGSCTITASQAGDGNYDAATSVPQTFSIGKATASVVAVGGSFTYDNTAKTGSATATGIGGASLPVSITYYAGNPAAGSPLAGAPVNAGTYTVRASFVGDANYNAASADAALTIGKASSTVLVSCPSAPVAYTGVAQTPCTAAATGAGGLNATLTPSYTNNTNAGTASASATFAGDANHDGNTGTGSFTIAKAASTTTVTVANAEYDGSPHGGTASVTGVGGLSQTLAVSYAGRNGTTYGPSTTAPVNAGDYTASATFAGDDNHDGSNDAQNFSIARAASAVAVSCPSTPQTYTGAAQTPCTATATGAGGLNVTLTPSYTNNTNVGTASVSATFAGDANHTGSSNAGSFEISKANPVVAAAGGSFTYTGSPQAGSGTATGVLNEDLGAVTLSYSGTGTTTYGPTATPPTDAGSYSVTASFVGSTNYNPGSSSAAALTIAKAASIVTVTCPSTPQTYTGAAQTPCTARATGAGTLDVAVTPVTHTNNTNAGTASASATYAGDANHDGSTGTGSFTIAKAASTTTVTVADIEYSGLPQGGTAAVSGVGGLSQSLSMTYAGRNGTTYGPSTTAPTNAGFYTASASFGGDANHDGSTDSKDYQITKAPLTVTTAAKTKVYGDANPTLTGSIGGIKNSDNITATYATTAVVGSAVGPYPITATLVDPDHKLGNYTVTNAGNTLSVTPASLTVTVDPQTKIQGAPLPTFTGSVTGQKNGDVITASYSTLATDMSPPGSYSITATLADPGSKLGNYTISNPGGTLTVTVNQPPSITATASPDPIQVGSNFTLSMVLSDADPAASTPYTVTIDWGDGKPAQTFQATATGALTKSYAYAAAGVYTVNVSVTDKVNTTATTAMKAVYQYAVIYDPNGGFVTGGGWINSPAGAYTADPALAGKATFGFVSKYQKGATVPSGNTEFQFQTAGFNFKSTSYEWLTISGSRAQYKGSGTINGSGDYGFLLTGIDGDVSGGGGTDKFRIKVWDKTTSTIIYDNQMGMDDTGTPTTVLGGGSIVIHTK